MVYPLSEMGRNGVPFIRGVRSVTGKGDTGDDQ